MTWVDESGTLVLTAPSQRTAVSPLQWRGSKGRMYEALEAHLFRDEPGFTFSGRYHELFLGGGSVFFGLSDRLPLNSAVLADRDEDLVNFYLQLRENSQALIEAIEDLDRQHQSDPIKLRQELESYEHDRIGQAAEYWYWRRTTYMAAPIKSSEGDWRGTLDDRVKILLTGRHRQILEDACHALSRAGLITAKGYDYELNPRPRKGDLVFLDPPYIETCNSTYGGGQGFVRMDWERLSRWARDRVLDGARVVLTHNDCPEIRRLFPAPWQHHQFAYRRAQQPGHSYQPGPKPMFAEVIIVGEPSRF